MSKLVSYELDTEASPLLSGEQEAEIASLAQAADAAIDYGDIPALDESFWRNATRTPYCKPIKQQLTLRLDADLVAWFKRQSDGGRGYQTAINRALREHVEQRSRKAG